MGASDAGIHCGSRSKCPARRDDVEPKQQGGFVGRDRFALAPYGERLLAFDAERRDVTASRTPSPLGGTAARLPKWRRFRAPQKTSFSLQRTYGARTGPKRQGQRRCNFLLSI